ncbi:pseudouridine synthase [Shewanella denitrificans OS217]|uniref:Pseudouridine synthase n=1 Tax=Shewanella denitrificans (strain OS217 / ATCC BAA-1090 / DSM 15013) TaxID=318161 RepID=Q12S02_SHEDO|nr:RluA family pseudouridine synthase [Shewanella denitrificans]ABE53774.1 pseudouridine synthase [Shewanella denitrificans OS217]
MPTLTMTNNAARAAQPSYVVLPKNELAPATVADFLMQHFSQIAPQVWRQRLSEGKVHWKDGELINEHTAYRPMARVYYYREVALETKVPFDEVILHQDEHAIIAYKPHFLPVTPSGNYVNECLVHRLRIKTGIDTIAPAHRLDKDTAGIVLLTLNPEVRHQYHNLFTQGQISKHYHALAKLTPEIHAAHQGGGLRLPLTWTVKNRLGPATPSFLMQLVEGEANSHSEIQLIAIKEDMGLFALSPITGKTHQLRVHMQSLGVPILNDRFYPQLQPKGVDNFDKPLKLLAQRLKFVDPISGIERDIQCQGFSLD